jgi:hypothetical protein
MPLLALSEYVTSISLFNVHQENSRVHFGLLPLWAAFTLEGRFQSLSLSDEPLWAAFTFTLHRIKVNY